MREPESAVFTNMCMICDGRGNVLVEDRVDPNWPGITFPGGHVEKGESFTDSVVREVYEETGLKVSKLRLCGIKNWSTENGGRYVILLYRTETFEGEIKPSDEGDVKWVPLSKLKNMRLANTMDVTLNLFCDETLSEQFYSDEESRWELK